MIPSAVVRDHPEAFREILLSQYTTWKIGGPCAAAFVSTPDELERAVKILENRLIPWTVLGRGSNTLAPTDGWNGAVVILSGQFLRFSFAEGYVRSGGGAPLPSMAGAACSMGLSGLVFAVGIPGTAGGAIYMNAGAYGSCMADLVEDVEVFTPGCEFITLKGYQCGFAYRTSVFQQSRSVIAGVRMKLSSNHEGPEELRRKAVDVLRLRREKFPLTVPNAGSVFKRPVEGPSPGRLIEECGLKGYSMGGARVSALHANFIENLGGATSDDVLRLIETVRNRVLEEKGIELHREIRLLGES